MSAQRRIVTVLFADVVGSTAIGEDLDPEDLGQLLTNYYRTAREVIETYGGTVEKFIGDAVMAIFGIPQAHDDDARRAIAAALELRERVRADPRLGERLPIRIGINTGEVATSASDGGDQAFVAGDAVNVAARLQQQAQPWSVLVGERTASAAAAAFAFGPPLDVAPRGRTAMVSAREVLAERSASPSPTPFVGREGDLDQLRLLAGRAFTERRPWLVTIVAPPGTGKTRLLNEFLTALSASAAPPLIVVARCVPYGEQLAYQPLRPIVDGIVGLSADAQADELLTALRAWLTDSGVAQPERDAELLAATFGLGSRVAPIQPNELFGVWRTFLEAAARRQPMVLAIEDLHWSSDSLLELIDFAMQPHANVPALLIAVARPDLFDRRNVWSTGRRNQTTIDLAPLSDELVHRIVAHVLPGAVPETVATVVARADGNPFFALEIARSVIERPTAHELPDTVQATIQARLDRLETSDRRVMEAGAIFGRSFAVAGVGALTGLSTTAIGDSVERLVERGLLVAGDGEELSAAHILIRDVAYGELPRAQRALLHRAAAEFLISHATTPDEQPTELIAVHYREAATLAARLEQRPPQLDGVREQAVLWLRRAADRALAAAASTDAVGHLEAALEIAAPEDSSAIYELIGDANLNPQSALAAYRQALNLARASRVDANVHLRLVGKLLLLSTRSWGGVAEGLSRAEMDALVRDGEELERPATDELAIARFLVGRAFVPFWLGGQTPDAERQAARTAAERGVAIARNIDDANLHSAALDALGSLADSWEEALLYARERLTLAARLDLAERIDAHSTCAWAACVTGKLHEAEQITAAGLALVEPGQVPSYALHLAAWRIGTLRLLGRWDELGSLGQTAIELWEATDRSAAGYATRGFADLLEVARARHDEASATRFARILEDIYRQFPGELGSRRNEVLIQPGREALAAYLADYPAIVQQISVYGQIDGYERVASRFIDEGGVLNADEWQQIATASLRMGCRIMAAQALRGIGLAQSSTTYLESALELAESASARPLAARIRVELGRMRGDSELVGDGMATLRDLGDLEHLSRLRAAR